MGASARSNVTAIVDAHLDRARSHYEAGKKSFEKSADEIIAAMELDSTLSYRKIGEAMGIHHTTVSRLLEHRRSGADRTTPFGDDHARLGRAVKQATREDPAAVAKAVFENPAALRALRDLQEGRAVPESSPRDEADDPTDAEPVQQPLLRKYDVILMGGTLERPVPQHVLICGDATSVTAKMQLLSSGAIPQLTPDLHGEMNVVVVTDQPYGQRHRRITNDHIANWGPVYSMFKPRGGFVFCAFHPPFFRAAEDGIIQAGGHPKHYLALDKGAGRMWGGDRVQNSLDAIIYFERDSNSVWPAGRRTVSLLRPDKRREVVDEEREMAGGHGTPKPINVLRQLIELATEPGDIVLDPFAGSGTALIAAHRVGRRFVGVELEPQWAERAVRRWMKETGDDPIVISPARGGSFHFTELEENPDFGMPEELSNAFIDVLDTLVGQIDPDVGRNKGMGRMHRVQPEEMQREIAACLRKAWDSLPAAKDTLPTPRRQRPNSNAA